MGRREQREQIFKLLFRVEFNKKEEMPEQLQLFFEGAEKPVSEQDQLYISGKYEKIMDKLPQIDELLNEGTEVVYRQDGKSGIDHSAPCGL